jgi:hypothetical protein
MHSQLAPDSSRQFAGSQNATRRELLRVVLRETLNRQGIPLDWIGAELLTTTSREGARGIHWRLLVKHWDTRILAHGVAIEHALIKRVTTFDPLASTWLNGISWQFALADESACPPLPHPGSWTAPANEAAPPTVPDALPSAGVIEGPVHIAAAAEATKPESDKDAESAKADLDRLLAIRDADFREHAGGEVSRTWVPTEPAKL